MKFETVKSFILFILVVISITLTFGLWYYQPNYEVLNEEGSLSELETDVGGAEASLSDVIQPNSMVFHNNVTDQHFTFKNPMKYMQLYNKIRSWALSDFEKKPIEGAPVADEQIEIRFPTELPMELLKGMFQISDDVTLPTWSFQRILLSFDESSSLLRVKFVSSDNKKSGVATVHNKKSYDLLWSYMSSPENMLQLVPFQIPESDREPIYIPAGRVSITQYSLSVNDTNPNNLVNALFQKPSLVSTTTGESYFTDGQRQMSLLYDGKAVEFLNPYSGSYDKMDVQDLITRSIQNINDHKGWTNDYYLADITSSTNNIRYQMHYKGYPVYSYSNLSIIGQKWRDERVYQYDRPLFQIRNPLPGEDTKELISGEEVIETLSDSPNYNMSKIRDLKIGYTLSYEDRATKSVTLRPSWYVNYDGNFREVNFDDADEMRE